MLGLVGTQIVGFLTHRLISMIKVDKDSTANLPLSTSASFNQSPGLLTKQIIRIFYVPLCYPLSRIVRKPDFCLGENKGADQLRGNREADQRLCFRYSDSIIPLLLIAKISSI